MMMQHRWVPSGNLKIKTAVVVILTSAFFGATGATAATLETIDALDQDQFKSFAESMGAATHYKSIAPVEPLGTIGFDVGIEVSSSDIDGDLFDLASDGDFGGTELLLPRVHVHKGLPFGLDVGASVGKVPDSDLTVLGAEVRYAYVDGNIVLPAIGVRLSHSIVQGLDELELNNSALELGISKGFLMLTPYAGVGVVKTSAEHNSTTLESESFNQNKLYVGATLNLGFAFTLEIDKTGDTRTYSAKAGIRF